jgi:glycosyltransferase involved in cell wall biosynthesis
VKIGLVIYGSLNTLSGGFLYDRKLVDFLRCQRDDVEIVSQPWSNYFGQLQQAFQPALVSRLKLLDVDVLLQDELNHPSLFWANQQICSNVAFPIISIVHHLRSSEQHPRFINWFYRAIENRYLMSVDGFIWNSQTTRNVVETLIRRKARGVVAYPAGDRLGGMTEEEITRRCQQQGILRLVFIGNLIPRKGLHTLISALVRLQKGSWNLRVVGSQDVDPLYCQQIIRMVAENRLQDQIQFLGKLSDAELAVELRQGQVMAMVSSYEGFGIVYLEGMSFGLPSIASSAGAAGEIIQNGVNGWLVKADDVAALADSIMQYQESNKLLLEHSLEARRHFEQFPTWEDSARQIRRFLLDFVEIEGRGRI